MISDTKTVMRQWMQLVEAPTQAVLGEATRVPSSLYHGTLSGCVSDILQHGLTVTNRKSFDISKNGFVYLSDEPETAEAYAVAALQLANPGVVRTFLGRPPRGVKRHVSGIAILQIEA